MYLKYVPYFKPIGLEKIISAEQNTLPYLVTCP